MGDKSAIEWTDATWNPVTGCTKVSAGCKYCYAERGFHRPYPGRAFTDVRVHPERLEQPLHWRKPRRVFVNSIGDLFHEAVHNAFLDAVFWVICASQRHTFQILTKRPLRMASYCSESQTAERLIQKCLRVARALPGSKFTALVTNDGFGGIALPNVWLGVSVEDQKTADERIPLLLQTPAAVRFVSYEPALGPVAFMRYMERRCEECGYQFLGRELAVESDGWGHPCPLFGRKVRCESWRSPRLDWVIAGGESGPGARPSHPDWFRSVRDQCQAAGVPFFFKQWGDASEIGCGLPGHPWRDAGWNPAAKRHGRVLDGREWNEYPAPQAAETPRESGG